MSRRRWPIVAVALRNTNDPRTTSLKTTWQKVESRLERARVWLHSKPQQVDFVFGSKANV